MEDNRKKTIEINAPMPEKIKNALASKREFMRKIQTGEVSFDNKNGKRVL